MTQDVPAAVVEVFRRPSRFLLGLHVSPDGDSIGSSLGLARALQEQGNQAVVASEEPVPNVYRFLPGADDVLRPADIAGQAFDVALLIDCGGLNRTGALEPLLHQVPVVVNIDHHLTNTGFGDVSWIDPDAASAGEMVYRLIKKMQWPLSPQVATCLYTAISTDTGSFRYQNTSFATLQTAAELVAAGASPFEVSDAVYEHKSLAAQRLLGYTLANMVVAAGGRLSYACLPWNVYEKFAASDEDGEGIVSELRKTDGVEVAVLVHDTSSGSVKVSFRSRADVDVSRIASRFGGGGHARAAACVFTGKSLDEVRDLVVAAVEEELLRQYGAE